MGLFRKGNTCIIAKFHRTDSVIGSHSGEGKILSYSRINMVICQLMYSQSDCSMLFYEAYIDCAA